MVNKAKYQKWSVQKLLEDAAYGRFYGIKQWQSNQIADLYHFMDTLHGRINSNGIAAGELLKWMVTDLNYLSYFQDYYGKGQHSDEKSQVVINFIKYVSQIRISPYDLLGHLEELDTTQGKPEEELIVFTTIFRTKGLEFDYVVIPSCDENALPYLRGQANGVYDTGGIVQENRMSDTLEAERRLFYVGLTRAKKGVFIGTSSERSRFLDEIHLRSTTTIMEALRWLSTGNQNGKEELLNALMGHRGTENTINNLINGYLPDLGYPELAEEIKQKMATVPVIA